MYTPKEFAEDQREFNWDLQGQEISYSTIQDHFYRLSRDQCGILKNRSDIRMFSECVRQLHFLTTLKISFDTSHHNRFFWFANRAFLDRSCSFVVHFETFTRALMAAQSSGLSIKHVEVTGMNDGIYQHQKKLLELATEGLRGITMIRLVDSLGLLCLLARVALPRLQELDLRHCTLIGPEIDDFVHKQHSLRTLRLLGVRCLGGLNTLTRRSSVLSMLQNLYPNIQSNYILGEIDIASLETTV